MLVKYVKVAPSIGSADRLDSVLDPGPGSEQNDARRIFTLSDPSDTPVARCVRRHSPTVPNPPVTS